MSLEDKAFELFKVLLLADEIKQERYDPSALVASEIDVIGEQLAKRAYKLALKFDALRRI